MLVRRLALLTTTAAAFALPAAAADAAVYCVDKPACAGLDTTFDGALADAAGSAANDRIEIGETQLAAALHVYDPGIDAGDLEIVGVGPTKSLILNKPGVVEPTLRILRGPGGNAMKISQVGLRMSSPAGDVISRGILTGAVVEDVTISTASPQPGKMLGIELAADGVLRDSTIKLAASVVDPVQRVGVFVNAPGTLIERSSVEAGTGVLASEDTRITRTGLFGHGGYGVTSCKAAVRVDNSLIRFENGATGVNAETSCGGVDQPTKTDLRQVTLRGDGSAGSTAVSCDSGAGDAAPITLRGSIVDGAEHDIRMTAAAGGSCEVAAANSRIDLADRVTEGAGVKKATNLGGNTTVSPGFVNAAGGDFRLKAGSSMLDVGTPGAIDPMVESTLDLLGKPRNVASKGFGTARRDMGAYEFQPGGLVLGDPGDPQDPKPDPKLGVPPAPKTPPAPQPTPAPAPGGGAPGAGQPGGSAGGAVPAPAADRRAPKLTRLTVTRSKGSLRKVKVLRRSQRAGATLRLVLDETAKVSVVLERRVGKRWVRKATMTGKLVGGRRLLSLRTPLGRAAAGRYRLRVGATDAAGNRSTLRTVSVKVARR